jgi:hypothetical protein
VAEFRGHAIGMMLRGELKRIPRGYYFNRPGI